MIFNAYSALKYWNLTFFAHAHFCFPAHQGMHIFLWISTYRSCVKKPLQQTLVVMGITKFTVIALTAEGQRIPQGARSIPKMPRREISTVDTRETHPPQCSKFCSQSLRAVDNSACFILDLGSAGCRQSSHSSLWPCWKGSLGITSLPNRKAVCGNCRTARVRIPLWRSLSPSPAQREGMQIKLGPVGFWVSWKLQIPQSLGAINSRPSRLSL